MKKTKSEEYQEGWREGYLAGFRAARDNESLMSPNVFVPTTFTGCQVCKSDITKGAWGYVCPRLDCPTRVTC